jgi:glutaconyl-CoA/methylmalonyl-CoA decarboxylase subunit delta
MEEYNKETIKEAISDEILAVIAAAVAAMEARPGYRLEVRSMRHVPQNSPAWNTAGRLERLSRNLNA